MNAVENSISTIERLEPALHAWAYFDADLARYNAEHAKDGPLHGVPIGVKDIFNTYDMPTQMGSPIWAGFHPGNDARVVHNLRQAGAVIMGKTVTAEFAVHTPGPTRNPHNTEYMAGTSSTGSAVAVAAGMVPMAIGTQTAGSTIRPASYCGVYGFKPTFGLVPRTGMLKTTDTLDTVGMFAKNVSDLRLLFDVLRVHGADYPYSELAEGEAKNVQVVVIGPQWKHIEYYAHAELWNLVAKYGCKIFPGFLYNVHCLHSIIYDKTLSYYFREEYKQRTLVSPTMYAIIERGNAITMDEYEIALAEQASLTAQFDAWMRENKIDILLDLSTGGEALKGLDSVDRPDNCLIWTFLGLPVINIPMFTGPNGLPFGLQAIARKYDDYKLLRFAEEVGK